MTSSEKEILLARISAVKNTVSDDLMRSVFEFLEEIASKLPSDKGAAGFNSK